ncbi:MAG: hypothetical protein M1812_000983 [Candelaria pacifica]|nr:MAG: hypothetical protein M1812_000983 [Candelaria pacifica]
MVYRRPSKIPKITAIPPVDGTCLFFTLPPELRLQIYTYTFPPSATQIQLIPYHRNHPTCSLNLPLTLYYVCRQIHAELPSLPKMLRSLNFAFIIDGNRIDNAWHSSDGRRRDDDYDLSRLGKILEVAERVRLVGGRSRPDTDSLGRRKWYGRIKYVSYRWLAPGNECAVRVLEVQPITWRKRNVARNLVSCLTAITTHADVVGRGLEIRLIRDDEGDEHPVDEVELNRIERWLRYYQGLTVGDRRKMCASMGIGMRNWDAGALMALGTENEGI